MAARAAVTGEAMSQDETIIVRSKLKKRNMSRQRYWQSYHLNRGLASKKIAYCTKIPGHLLALLHYLVAKSNANSSFMISCTSSPVAHKGRVLGTFAKAQCRASSSQ